MDPVDEQAKAKAALTELFAEVKTGKTPVVVERIVTDIDEIVRMVRFPGWQNTKAESTGDTPFYSVKISPQPSFETTTNYNGHSF